MPTLTPAVSLRTAVTGRFARIRDAWPRVVAAFESAWVAYPLLLILQLKVIWGLWKVRDVTSGDTTSYFSWAWAWFNDQVVNIAWSPLYTAFYGSLLFINSDPGWATLAHRVIIVVTAALLVLAVMRQLLPASIAWLCAAWWAVLPIVFDTLYEVHLFAAIPVLTVWLLLLTARGPWRRAAALAILCASAILVRNELSVPCGVLGLALAFYEWRRAEPPRRPGRVLLAYGVSLALAAGLCLTAYRVSVIKYPALSDLLKHKHTVNMAQVYAFAYQQRHPEWTLNPWIECYSLMEETFGNKLPTLREMIAANPRAVAEHFAWNLALTPNGLQLLLFNRASGSVTPDYDSAILNRLNSRRAAVLSGILVTIWAVGLVALWRSRREWWRDWLSQRALGWVGMLAVSSVVLLVILTQRPRPSYLFAFGAVLIAVTGMCFYVATNRWRLAERLRYIMPAVMVALVLLAPRHFKASAQPPARTVANGIERLLPFRSELLAGNNGLVVPQSAIGAYVYPLARYTHPRDQRDPTRVVERKAHRVHEFGDFMGVAAPDESYPDVLARHHVTHVYLDQWALNILVGKQYGEATAFVEGRTVPGWELASSGETPGDRWRIYRRVK